MTAQELARCTGSHIDRSTAWLPFVEAAMAEFEINMFARQAAFLAQIGHESESLRYTREIWGPTPVQARYEGRVDLDNTEAGDGARFRGRGLIQITGRTNYAQVGRALGVDLVAEPERLQEPDLAARSAGWFWHKHGLNELADAGDFIAITHRINGGENGLADRMLLWEAAKEVLA